MDHPFDDQIIDEQYYFSHLNDWFMAEEEDGKIVEYLQAMW